MGQPEQQPDCRIELPEQQRERFDQIKAECTDEHLPEPTDDQIMKSLMDTWDAVTDGYYSGPGGSTNGTERPDLRTIENETLRLASMEYSIETQARIETLLWVLGYIDDDKCPSGAADHQRVRELTNRGCWPFDPSLERFVDTGIEQWLNELEDWLRQQRENAKEDYESGGPRSSDPRQSDIQYGKSRAYAEVYDKFLTWRYEANEQEGEKDAERCREDQVNEYEITFGPGFSEADIESIVNCLDENGFRTENFEIEGSR